MCLKLSTTEDTEDTEEKPTLVSVSSASSVVAILSRLWQGEGCQRRPRRIQHVLPVVEHVGDRTCVQRRAGLVVPEVLPRARVERHQVAGRAAEDEARRGGQHAGKRLARERKLPALLTG